MAQYDSKMLNLLPFALRFMIRMKQAVSGTHVPAVDREESRTPCRQSRMTTAKFDEIGITDSLVWQRESAVHIDEAQDYASYNTARSPRGSTDWSSEVSRLEGCSKATNDVNVGVSSDVNLRRRHENIKRSKDFQSQIRKCVCAYNNGHLPWSCAFWLFWALLFVSCTTNRKRAAGVFELRFWDLLTDASRALRDRQLDLQNYRSLHVRIAKAREYLIP